MSLTPVSQYTIVSAHRTHHDQIVLRARGRAGRDFLERFQNSRAVRQLEADTILNGDELIIHDIPAQAQARFDAMGATVGASWSVWDAGHDPQF